ncbi:MAG: hypothetical protein QOJ65_2801 [Fimbriimonadaceae bacterium]|jgi:hypothetical protein|nr:hypothetical protein [Fimbriimonadaceae bacterium]
MNRVLAILALLSPILASAQRPAIIDGISFYDEPGALYLPAKDVGRALAWRVGIGPDGETLYLNRKPVRTETRRLANGQLLVSLAELKRRGLALTPSGKMTKVRVKQRAFYARNGAKRVVINKSHMQMSAWQGQRVVLSSPVTLGIEGHDTPSGIFQAQGYRAKMHKSKLYKNAPMPWTVHIVGNVFIHGWPKVESGRASHGCIRLPLSRGNPARFFYYWVDKGTPVSILGKWPRGAKVQ